MLVGGRVMTVPRGTVSATSLTMWSWRWRLTLRCLCCVREAGVFSRESQQGGCDHPHFYRRAVGVGS